jgi:lipid-A-disaccharide synthase-like uncharacterized protein
VNTIPDAQASRREPGRLHRPIGYCSAMTSSIDPRPARAATPWHLWVVGAVFLLLYAIGAYDYVQVQAQSEVYYQDQGYGPAQIAYFADYPFVPMAFWTINIVGGLATVVLLALRSRWSVLAAATAVLSQVCLQIITFGFMDRWSILGSRLALTDIGVMVLTFGLWIYCRHMHRQNVLSYHH